jgi:lipopolysaccharide export system permease protein
MSVGGLRMGGILDRYIGGLFVAAYATALLLVIGLQLIIYLASNLDHFEPWPDGTTPATLDVIRFYLLNTPYLFLQVAPYVTAVAGLFTISRMIRNNETVAALAAGISAQRLLLPILFGGATAMVAMIGLREWAAVAVGPRRDALLDMLEEQRREPVYENVWFNDRVGDVVHIREFRPATGTPPIAELRGVEILGRRGDVVIQQTAQRAIWAAGRTGPRWVVEEGFWQEVDDQKTRRPIGELQELAFTPRDVLLSIKGQEKPLELSFTEIDSLSRADPDDTGYLTLLQYSITFPIANLLLLMVSLPLLLGRERGHQLEGLVGGFLMCVVYFAVDFVSRALGMEGTLSPLVSSWLPVLLFGSLGIALFESART